MSDKKDKRYEIELPSFTSGSVNVPGIPNPVRVTSNPSGQADATDWRGMSASDLARIVEYIRRRNG